MNSLYGTRVAVLAGDFLFAQSSWFLANLNNLEVIKLISQVRPAAFRVPGGGSTRAVPWGVLSLHRPPSPSPRVASVAGLPSSHSPSPLPPKPNLSR